MWRSSERRPGRVPDVRGASPQPLGVYKGAQPTDCNVLIMARTKRTARRDIGEPTESGGGLTAADQSLITQYLTSNSDPLLSETASNTSLSSACSMQTHPGATDSDSVSTLSDDTCLWNPEPRNHLVGLETPPVIIDLTSDEGAQPWANLPPIDVGIALPSQDAPSGSATASCAPPSDAPEVEPAPTAAEGPAGKKKPSTTRRRKAAAPTAEGEGTASKKPRGRNVAKKERTVSPITPMLSIVDEKWPLNFDHKVPPIPTKVYHTEGPARNCFFEVYSHPTEPEGVSVFFFQSVAPFFFHIMFPCYPF